MSEGWPEYRGFWAVRGAKSIPKDGFYSFLSYSRRDDEYKLIEPFVRQYIDMMSYHVRYIPIFIDYFYFGDNNIPNLYECLRENVFRSDFTTAFISPGYAGSPWCNFEWWESIRLSREDNFGKHEQFQKQIQHKILSFIWKELPGRDKNTFSVVEGCVDLCYEFSESDWQTALEKAVAATLHFIEHAYRVEFFRVR
jgi:hypothetical protein